jgi:hypothetical protein
LFGVAKEHRRLGIDEEAVLRNRSPKGFFLSNREFIAKRGEKQGLSIRIGYLSCRSVCDFNGIAQGQAGFLLRPKTGVVLRIIRHILAPYQA